MDLADQSGSHTSFENFFGDLNNAFEKAVKRASLGFYVQNLVSFVDSVNPKPRLCVQTSVSLVAVPSIGSPFGKHRKPL